MAKHNSAFETEDKIDNSEVPTANAAKPHCGIIMPLSDTDGYPSGHWGQVQKLIIRAAEQAGFTASMVSDNLAEDMIQASIVRNIYQNDVVVCDVSSLNPNVMLELGMRMSTLLPLVLVFDGAIKYPFDINSILHERYPKGLNIFRMEDFVNKLALKIQKVHDAQQAKEYQPFLSHFKEVHIEPAKLDAASQDAAAALGTILNEIVSIKDSLNQNIKNSLSTKRPTQLVEFPQSGVTPYEQEIIDTSFEKFDFNKHLAVKDFENIINAVMTDVFSQSPSRDREKRASHIYSFVLEALLSKRKLALLQSGIQA